MLNKGKIIKKRISIDDNDNSCKAANIAKGEGIYLDFLNAVERSNAIAEVRYVQIIDNAAQYDWSSGLEA